MAGSLWRQAIGSGRGGRADPSAGRLRLSARRCARRAEASSSAATTASGFELWRLDLATGHEQVLTIGGAVNVEPRLSPDGRRIAWVSTQGTGPFQPVHCRHWLGWTCAMPARCSASAGAASRAIITRRSTMQSIRHGRRTASASSMSPTPKSRGARATSRRLRSTSPPTGACWSSEETSWNARPETSPDGEQVLFSSYHGRQWRQLWLTTPEGAAPLPLTFGEFDRGNARWSPDGERIAFISNEHGNTSLVVLDCRRRRADADRRGDAALLRPPRRG